MTEWLRKLVMKPMRRSPRPSSIAPTSMLAWIAAVLYLAWAASRAGVPGAFGSAIPRTSGYMCPSPSASRSETMATGPTARCGEPPKSPYMKTGTRQE